MFMRFSHVFFGRIFGNICVHILSSDDFSVIALTFFPALASFGMK